MFSHRLYQPLYSPPPCNCSPDLSFGVSSVGHEGLVLRSFISRILATFVLGGVSPIVLFSLILIVVSMHYV